MDIYGDKLQSLSGITYEIVENIDTIIPSRIEMVAFSLFF